MFFAKIICEKLEKKIAYSVQFRKKILKLQAAGESFIKLSKRFQISTTTITRWKKALMPKKNRNKQATKIDYQALKQYIENYPDAYSYERARRLGVSASDIKYAKKRIDVTYKKLSIISKWIQNEEIYFFAKRFMN